MTPLTVERYHEGELEMQHRAGVRELADRVSRIVNADIPAPVAAFAAAQRFVIVSTVGENGAPTASLLGGAPGFLSASHARSLTIAPSFGHRVPVEQEVDATGVIGVLAIDLATRRRIRVNGTAERDGASIVVSTAEVYGNCPQYIRPRAVRERGGAAASHAMTGHALSPEQARWIAEADTFFLATSHPQRGADASHRGGPPGFVTPDSPVRLTWPDFPGNNMFNSLGNLTVNPRSGLLFLDFERGATLQLRGNAHIEGDAERAVIFDVEDVIETVDAVPLRWD